MSDALMGPSSAVLSLVLSDGRLPTGGHAHSAGLEPALAAGLTADRIGDYIAARLASVALVDAATAVLARRICAEDSPRARDLGPRLETLTDEYFARTPSEPLRTASTLLGRGMLRLGRRLWPQSPVMADLAGLQSVPRPVALGAVCAIAGLSDEQTARTSVYEDVQTVAYAAPKLLPVDPADPIAWVIAAAARIETAVAAAVAVPDAPGLPAFGAPEVEIWSVQHAHRARRIFHA